MAGVNLMLLPGVGTSFAVAGMTSPRGRCHTFDSRADGYARGEACCAWRCCSRRRGCPPVCRLLGSCVRQDGKSASLTAPNGQAQQALLRAALADAAVLADAVAAGGARHGHGAGRPDRGRSLAAACSARARRRRSPLALGSVKANAGHAEPAAGVSGLLRLAVGAGARRAAPNAQLRVLNAHVRAALPGDAAALALPVMGLARPSASGAASGELGGVSSFGYSGTIAHALLRSTPSHAWPRPPPPQPPRLVSRRRAFKWGAAAERPTEVEAHLERPGSLLHLHTRAQAVAPCTLEAHGGVVAVAAAGLNFRDVLNVLGRDPTGQVRPLGGEVSGRLLARGADVTHAEPGDRVFGLAPGSLRSVLHTDTRWLGRMPRALSFDEAVTLPVLWVTVAYAVREARVRAGQRVLLHSATGGVGLVALEQLRRCGARVHATAGSAAKHATLRRLGVTALSSSRRAESFAAGAGAQLRGGRVQVVLSALSRDFTPASLGQLGEAGAFLDIGKNGVWSVARAAAAAAAADFVAVAVDDGCRNCPGWNGAPLWMQAQLGRLARQVDAGAVRPPPHATFSFCEGELRAALRLLQAGENVGKVVVRVRCARRTPPPITHAAPFALPSVRLSGALSGEEAACLVAGLPTDAACLVELHSAQIADPTPALVAFARSRAAPLLVLCSGASRGAAALLLIDAATVLIGVRGARIAATDRHHLARRLPAATAENSADGADGVGEGSWLDYVGTEAAARAEARRVCNRLASLPSQLLARCHTELPAATTDGALVVMGSLWPRAARRAGARLVRVWVDEPHGVAIVELHDPKRSNTWSVELGEDLSLAAEQLTARGATVRAVVLRGAGAHFSAGGNPHAHARGAPLAAAAAALRRTFAGFAALRALAVPLVCAAHGTVIGGGNAACLSCDYVVAEAATTFEHGNLVRGVCPLGGYSRTLPHVAGRARALAMYMSDGTLGAAEARAAGIVHEVCAGGVAATHRRALELARRLAAPPSPPSSPSPHEAAGRALVAARAHVDASLLDAEAVGHAACLAAGASLRKASAASASAADSRAPAPLALPHPFAPALGATKASASRNGGGAVHVVRVPRHLGGRDAPLPTWPERVLPVFRGADPEHFCLGGDPAALSSLQSGAFLDGLPAFAELHERLARAPLPCVVVCHGATRGGGMLFPCLGTIVLAHADATFGFPEVRRGALPGVVSVAARRRLSAAACDRAFCTGDSLDAPTALRLGLVDFVGSWEQIEAELTRITARCAAVGYEWLERCCSALVPSSPPPVLASPPEGLTTDDGACVVRIGTAGCRTDAALLQRVCHGLAALTAAAAPSLRVVLLSVGTEENGGGNGHHPNGVTAAEEAQLVAAVAALTERGVAVVCALVGTVRGAALLVSLAAHYRIVGARATLLSGGAQTHSAAAARMARATLLADDDAAFTRMGRAGADEAVGLGLASEVAEDAEERARQFAHWLLLQPAVGMRQVLRLTFRRDDDFVSPEAAGGYARKLGAVLLERDSGAKAARAALKRLLRDPHETGLARLSAGPGDSEQASLLAAAAAARLGLASSPAEAASQSEPIGPPSVPDASAERRAGIHALEIYTPRHAVDAAELEKAHDVPGKYTEGLMMREWSACDEDEDVVTMALTAVRRLVEAVRRALRRRRHAAGGLRASC